MVKTGRLAHRRRHPQSAGLETRARLRHHRCRPRQPPWVPPALEMEMLPRACLAWHREKEPRLVALKGWQPPWCHCMHRRRCRPPPHRCHWQPHPSTLHAMVCQLWRRFCLPLPRRRQQRGHARQSLAARFEVTHLRVTASTPRPRLLPQRAPWHRHRRHRRHHQHRHLHGNRRHPPSLELCSCHWRRRWVPPAYACSAAPPPAARQPWRGCQCRSAV